MTPLVRAWHAHCKALEAEGISFEAALARLQDLGQIVPGPQIPERTWRIL